MKKMVATKSMTYRTRRLRAGDEFEASPRDARILSGIGKAKRKPEEAPKVYKTRAVRAAPVDPVQSPPTPEPEPPADDPPGDPEDLSLLTNAELRRIAEMDGIDVSACKVKADLVNAINAARNEDDI